MSRKLYDRSCHLRTFRQAAGDLGVGYHKIQRAAKRGLIPIYRIGDSRPYVMLDDIYALMGRDRPDQQQKP
jgi:predicted site-specific integrase-resolvase